MSRKHLCIALCIAAAGLIVGCLPSDATIDSQVSEARREAYLEWKAMRASGHGPEAKVDGPLSLNDAVRLALQYNKNLQQQILERDVTRGSRIATYNVILPRISANGLVDRVEHQASRQGAGSGGLANYSLGLKVDQPIMQGNKYPAQIRQARLLTALTDQAIRSQVQELVASIAYEYYDVLLAQHLLDVQRDALTSAQAQFRTTSEKRRQETATDADVLRARSEVARYQSAMITQQNEIDTHRVNLFKLMGVSQDSDVTFSDQLEFLPMRPVLERAVEIASGQRPDLRTAELNARMAEESLRIARSDFMPALAASFSTGWSEYSRSASGKKGSLHNSAAYDAGLGMSWSFGIDKIGSLEQRKAEAKQSRIAVLDAQENMLQSIRLQMNILNNAEETINALVESQAASREALRLVEVGYQAGVRTEVEVTDARSSLTTVIGQYYTSINQHAKARVALQVAMGVLGPTHVTDGTQAMPNVPIANIQEFAADDYVPPAPIIMPAPERHSPDLGRIRQEIGAAAPAAAPMTQTAPAVSAPVSAAPAAPAPAAAVTSANNVLFLPPPPAESAPAPAAQPAAQPVFKITVRDTQQIAQR